jgi:hypothetical protein
MRPQHHKTVAIRGLFCLPAILTLCSCGRSGVPSRLDRIPADLANPALQSVGVYPDGWIGANCSLLLLQPSGKQALTIRGMVPKIGAGAVNPNVEVRVDDQVVIRQPVGIGDFRLSGPVAEGSGTRKIAVTFGSTQELPGGDGRQVGARLQFVGFETPSATSATPSLDILNGAGAQLGAGWGTLETFHNETFRWVMNDAEIRLDPVSSAAVELSAILEAGPGIGDPSFVLKVLDASGKEVGTSLVQGRGSVKIAISVPPGKPDVLRLHIDGGGKTLASDPRILNFRVFQLAVRPLEGSGH